MSMTFKEPMWVCERVEWWTPYKWLWLDFNVKLRCKLLRMYLKFELRKVLDPRRFLNWSSIFSLSRYPFSNPIFFLYKKGGILREKHLRDFFFSWITHSSKPRTAFSRDNQLCGVLVNYFMSVCAGTWFILSSDRNVAPPKSQTTFIFWTRILLVVWV